MTQTTEPRPSPPPVGRTGSVVIAVCGLVAAAVMGMLWASARSTGSDARIERDATQLQLDAIRDSRLMAADTVIELRSELTRVQDENRRLAVRPDAERTATQAADDSAAASAAASTAVDRSDELADEVRDLTERNEALTTSVASLEERLAEVAANAAAAAAEPAEPAGIDAAAMPDFARYLGEVLSSRRGSSPLSSAESTCFGSAVIDAIGLDAVGRGLHLDAKRADNNVVVQAMQDAATACGIDPALIF